MHSDGEQENQGHGRGHRQRRAFNPFGSQFTNGSYNVTFEDKGIDFDSDDDGEEQEQESQGYG